jgi:hypothetical protein
VRQCGDGEMWRSNGPIYVTKAFHAVYDLQITTYAACFLFAKIGRPHMTFSSAAEALFANSDQLCLEEIATSYRELSERQKP